jgi:hypothetical protein
VENVYSPRPEWRPFRFRDLSPFGTRYLLRSSMNPVHGGRFLAGGAFIYRHKRDDQTIEEILELQCNLVIPRGVIFKHGIDTTLLNIGSGQAWPGSQQR